MDEPVTAPDITADKGPETKPETPKLFEKIVKYCDELYGKFSKSDYRTKQLALMAESARVYAQEEEENSDFPFDNAVNNTLPLTAITVDNMEPRLVAGLIGKDPIIRFEMEGMTQQDEPTQILEDWYNKELKNIVRIKEAVINLVHTILLDGTWYGCPRYTTRKKKKMVFQMGQGGIPAIGADGNRVVEEKEQTLSEGGKIEPVPFVDVFCPDDVGTQEEWENCDKIRIVRPTYAELQRAKKGIGYITGNIGPHLLSGKTSDTQKSPGQELSGVEVTGKEVIECLECHISYPIYQDEEKEEDEQTNFEEERIIVTISKESKTVIRFCKQTDLIMENESLLKRVRLFPEPGKSFGTPMYGKLKSIQNGGSDIFNMLINIAYLTMMPWFFYDSKSGLRGEKKLKPGEGVAVDDVNGIKIPEFRINPGEYLQFMQIFMSMWEKLGKISDTQIGRTRDENTTATEIMTVVQEGNISHNFLSEQIKDEFLEVLRTLYTLYYERMNPQKEFQYGKIMVKIPYADMKKGFKFVLNGSTEAANKYIERREKEDMMKMFAADPIIIPTKPREELLKAYGVTDTTGWINPQVKMVVDIVMQNPEVVQVVGEYMQQKQAVASVINGGQNVGRNEGTGSTGSVSGVPAKGIGGGNPAGAAGMAQGGPAVRPGMS